MSDAGDGPDPIAATRLWLEHAVIGLNLCPFAKAVQAKGQVRFVLSEATTPEALLAELGEELLHLRDTPAADVDTTLVVHPQVLGDFLDYNDFLEQADALVIELELEGVLQVASFHPQYQFAGTLPDDIENCTNRSPYPTLHLLRRRVAQVQQFLAQLRQQRVAGVRIAEHVTHLALGVHRLCERAQVEADHGVLQPAPGRRDRVQPGAGIAQGQAPW